MDLLSQHEAFLRAIFDAPDDDTPRLVYADFLQEHGEEERAEFIRLQCERGRINAGEIGDLERERLAAVVTRLDLLRAKLVASHPELLTEDHLHIRGFRVPGFIAVPDGAPDNTDEFRKWVVFTRPEWFGATAVRGSGRIDPDWFDPLFNLAAFARVTELYLAGDEVADEGSLGPAFTVYTIQPIITTAGVVALAQHRGVRRITSLDLRNNELDNDAARALVQSPYLDNLKRLQLLEGNRFRGRVWQQVIERFGEDVVG